MFSHLANGTTKLPVGSAQHVSFSKPYDIPMSLAEPRLRSVPQTELEERIEFADLDVYNVGAIGERFDFVIFMGVLYHLRHPLLALDLIHEHVASDLLLFQSMQRGSKHVLPLEADYPFEETSIFFETGFPKFHFVQREYSHDWTNWWVPNRACTEAMLRSAGFAIEKRIEEEVYLCRKSERSYAKYGPAAVYPAREATE